MKYQITELWLFYNNYKWDKCSKDCFYKRVRNWMSFNEAIKKWHLMKIKNKISTDWRVCRKCNKRKSFFHYSTWKSYCKICTRIESKKYEENNKEKIALRRKKKRETDLIHIKRIELDNIFYNDKNIKKIIQIEWKEKRIKRAVKWDIQKDKFFYFLNKWYDKDMLITLYWNHYLWI